MKIQERQQQILNYLLESHFASIDEIAKNIYFSPTTVRRDLQKLEEKVDKHNNLIDRMYKIETRVTLLEDEMKAR
mgnify:CR=1 FL=1